MELDNKFNNDFGYTSTLINDEYKIRGHPCYCIVDYSCRSDPFMNQPDPSYLQSPRTPANPGFKHKPKTRKLFPTRFNTLNNIRRKQQMKRGKQQMKRRKKRSLSNNRLNNKKRYR